MDIRLVVALLVLSLGVSCPVYQCAEMNRGVCAEVEDGVVTVNSIGCPAQQFCYLSLLQEGGQLPIKTTVMCAELPQSRGFAFGEDESLCESKDQLARLAEGAHPKRCNGGLEDPACLLANGEFAPCDCGLDSQMYCRYSSGDSTLDAYYTDCANNDGAPSRRAMEYWDVYRVFGHVAASAQECMVNTVYELGLLAGNAPSNGVWLTAAGAILVSLN